jgi:hypothetical protein
MEKRPPRTFFDRNRQLLRMIGRDIIMRGHINVLWPTYGFVADEQSRRNYYFHRRGTESDSHAPLCLHDLVEFEVTNGEGVPEAVNVRHLPHQGPSCGEFLEPFPQ